MNKADNLQMSAEEYFDLNIGKYDKYSEIMEAYANYLLSHHINALTERKYSEEDMINYAIHCSILTSTKPIGYPFPEPKDWINQSEK